MRSRSAEVFWTQCPATCPDGVGDETAADTDEVTAGAADGTGDGSAGAEADGTGDGPYLEALRMALDALDAPVQ